MTYPYDPNRKTYPAPIELADRSAERVLSALAHGGIALGFFGFGFMAPLGMPGLLCLRLHGRAGDPPHHLALRKALARSALPRSPGELLPVLGDSDKCDLCN